MITPNLQKMIMDAMKARDSVRVSTLKLLSAALNYDKIEKMSDLTEEEELNVVRKQVKQRRDSIEAYEKAGKPDMAQSEKAELTILQEFLPPEISDEELNQLITDSISQLNATTMADMGKVIADVKSKNSNIDGSKLAQMVRQKLS